MTKRRLAAAIVILTVFLGLMNLNIVNAADEVEQLTMDKAVTYALEHNPDLKMINLEIEKNKIESDRSDYHAKKIEEPTTYDEAYSAYIMPLAAQRSYESSLLELEVKKNKVVYDVKKAFYDLVKETEQLQAEEDNFKLLKDKEKLFHGKLSAGLITPLEYSKIQNDLLSAEIEVESAKNSKISSMEAFNRVLGLPLSTSTEIEYTLEQLVIDKADEFSLVEAIEEALKNRLEAFNSKTRLDLGEKTFEMISRYLVPNTFDYRVYKFDPIVRLPLL